MNNEKIKILLTSCPINVKWNNMGTWQKDEYTNLFEMVEYNNIKISDNKGLGKGFLNIKWNYGNQNHLTRTHTADIERDLYIMLAQKCLYLGDKYKITTRLRNYSL